MSFDDVLAEAERRIDAEQAGWRRAYDAGYDCGQNGPNEKNCHFGLFATPQMTKAWERGKADAERD